MVTQESSCKSKGLMLDVVKARCSEGQRATVREEVMVILLDRLSLADLYR